MLLLLVYIFGLSYFWMLVLIIAALKRIEDILKRIAQPPRTPGHDR